MVMRDFKERSTERSELWAAMAAGGDGLRMEEAKHGVLDIKAAASSKNLAAAQHALAVVESLNSIEPRCSTGLAM